jgi:CheY-like chemotaxis protein
VYSVRLLEAIAALLWPIVVATVLFFLLPVLRRLIKDSQAVEIEIAGTKLSIQSASEALRNQVADLQDRIIALEAPASTRTESYEAPDPPERTRKILWVDDVPGANVYERARVMDVGYKVVQAESTGTALRALESAGPFEVVVSDMTRVETGGNYNTRAGLELVRAMRQAGDQTPVVFYSSPQSLEPALDEIGRLTNVAYTTSPTELMSLLRISGSAL